MSSDLLNQNQEQTVKCAFLAYKTAVISTDLIFYGEKRQTQMENIQKMFNYLFFKLSYKELKANLWNQKKLSDPKLLRFRQVCETHLNQITDVFIQIISTVHSEAGKDGE